MPGVYNSIYDGVVDRMAIIAQKIRILDPPQDMVLQQFFNAVNWQAQDPGYPILLYDPPSKRLTPNSVRHLSNVTDAKLFATPNHHQSPLLTDTASVVAASELVDQELLHSTLVGVLAVA